MTSLKTKPPHWAERLVSKLLRDDLSEEVLGDLEEKFYHSVKQKSIFIAKLNYWYQVLNYLRPFALRKSRSNNLVHFSMFKNNLKIGWRNIIRHKSLFAINTGGLALGIATCLIIMLFISDELSYDRYNENANQIVRVVLKGKMGDEIIKEAVTPGPVAPTLKLEFPEVVNSTRLRNFGTPQVTYKNTVFRNSRVAFVDPGFFDVFTLLFIKGDPKTALIEPNTIVITEDEALKYFGKEDPLGQILDFKEWSEKFKVTGVIKRVPVNSHFHFDQFASMEGLAHANEPRWLESNYQSYLLLRNGYYRLELEEKLPLILEKYMGPQIQQHMGMSLAEFNEKGNEIGLFLQPLTDIHLYSDFTAVSELEPGGDIKSVYIFGVIALFILLVASINFMNLTTAAASRRAKEVGIKKVLGSRKKQLLLQFLTESFMSTLSAVLVALVFVFLALPIFNNLSGKMLEANDLMTFEVILYFVLFGVSVSLLAGSYPAFFLSSFKPLQAIKTKFTNPGGKGIRSSLVIFQFSISVVLVIATIVVDQQMSFIQNKEVGYNKDLMLIIRDSGFLGKNQEAFKEQLLNHASVENVTMSGHVPAGPTNNNMAGFYPNPESKDLRRTIIYNIDNSYLPTMGMELLSGRNFSNDFGSEDSNVIVNETFVKTFGLSDEPIGKTIKRVINNTGGTKNLTIIGVVKDFHFRPLHQAVEPLVMQNIPNNGLIIKAKTANMSGLVADIEKMWDEFNVNEPFNYALLDELYNQTYLKEQKTGTLLRIFALLTIFVACLGLFGLVTFTAEQRVKEIGIRKILGSTVAQIIAMLSFDFLKLIFISFLIAFPLGFYLMNQWLEDFVYHTSIHWWVMPLAGVLTIAVAVFTISFKSLKVALANPVDALRDE